MSDAQKTVEETPAVVPAVETIAETPAEAAVEAPKETEAEPTATPVVESTEGAEAVKEEVKPATEGVLGYKAPGLVKGFRFAKRFFYFNEEAVESKNLSVFHQNEKAAIANPTAAWASQTGKGLLFFTKRAEDKATPAGILNLADVSDVTKEGTNEFLFKLAGHKHTFQASSAAERDSWVVAIEAQSTEAKAEKETIISSEGYKAEFEKLTKPAVVVAAVKKPEEKKEEAPIVPAEAAQEEPKEEKKEEKVTAKSRSQSRKRTSIFGSLLGKKDAEEKKEETPAAEETKAAEPAAEPSVEAPAPVVAEITETAAAPTEVAEATAETPAEVTEAAKEEVKDEKKAEKKAKRASIFGNFFQKVASPSQEKSEKEATAPAVEETPVASTAPQLENPVEEAAAKPIEAEAVTAPAEAVETPAAETPAEAVSTPKEKRRTSFFGNLGMKKEKKAESSDNEVTDGEGKETKAKSNKLGGLFRKPSKAVKLDKEEVAATETEAADEAPAVPAKETATEDAPAVIDEAPKAAETVHESKNVSVAAATPVQAAA
ncbi:uncharacterized protein N7479_002143 [Penicillium vulpinum]|uniref:PH domain-containing protein n=1 Tax=Penicillium vulpinum TaxID=29845 RepID=A0A1V6S7U0_9EURO|nr:uncharacterized protein N7479_002143 [Penicillium vulpinum]KAJ5972225.1 hypothetical protein N7479_002143 [Penicillium vulpinum]OQE09918.1 hypothetical protein PENVUL_c005G02571 [Penicillium vulpinum]